MSGESYLIGAGEDVVGRVAFAREVWWRLLAQSRTDSAATGDSGTLALIRTQQMLAGHANHNILKTVCWSRATHHGCFTAGYVTSRVICEAANQLRKRTLRKRMLPHVFTADAAASLVMLLHRRRVGRVCTHRVDGEQDLLRVLDQQVLVPLLQPQLRRHRLRAPWKEGAVRGFHSHGLSRPASDAFVVCRRFGSSFARCSACPAVGWEPRHRLVNSSTS
jgi:hypothetical protein